MMMFNAASNNNQYQRHASLPCDHHQHHHQQEQQWGAMPPMRDHKPILAERFKTKMCKNFVEHGHCPYVFRCMFAHGDHELRTKQMNLADGLYTEEAIKAFKRARYEAEKAAQYAAHMQELEQQMAVSKQLNNNQHYELSMLAESDDAASSEGSIAPSPRPRRHDPYAQFSAWHPLRGAAASPRLVRNATPVAPVKLAAGEPMVIVP